jgi:hypothetical protein
MYHAFDTKSLPGGSQVTLRRGAVSGPHPSQIR